MKIIFNIILYCCCLGLFLSSCAKKESSSGSSSSSASTTASDYSKSSFSVSEITQTNEGDGYLSGSFVVPSDGISFMLATFMDNNSVVAFYSLSDPDGTNILSSLNMGRLWICQCSSTTDAELQCKSWDMDI